MKRLQNRIAQSTALLPVMAMTGLGVWIASGGWRDGLWLSLALFAVSTYLMVELSNANALLRVRSRMVSAVFIAFTCASSFLFADWRGLLAQTCFIGSLLLLFGGYQERQATGRTYYAFLLIGVASVAEPPIVWTAPLLLLLMATQLQVYGPRISAAALLGMATPCWVMLPWILWTGAFSWYASYLAPMLPGWEGIDLPTLPYLLAYALVVLLTLVAALHFWNRSFEDKTRIRLLYGFLTTLTAFLAIAVLLQPSHYALLLRLLIVVASPLVAHFFTLTNSKATNAAFVAAAIAAALVTALSIIEN